MTRDKAKRVTKTNVAVRRQDFRPLTIEDLVTAGGGTSSGIGGNPYRPLSTGEEPIVLVSDGAGAAVMVAFEP